MERHRRRAAHLAAAMLLLLGTGAGRDKPEIARGVLDRLQAERREEGVGVLAERPVLGEVARRRAAAIAARAPELRLSQETPIEGLLEDAGILRYGRVREHVELQQGYAQAADAALERWKGAPDTWPLLMDPRWDAVGVGTVVGQDGWLALVVVLLEDLDVPEDLGAWEARLIEEVNRVRAEHGLPPQVASAPLAQIARLHSEDMAARGFFAHETPEGHDLSYRIRGLDLRFTRLAENIGRNHGLDDPVAAALDGWMTSASHRKNLLDERFVETGVGIAVDEHGTFYFTQVFIEPAGR